MATTTKKKTTKRRTKQKVWIGLLIDESYSMNPNRKSVIDSVNEFVANIREEDNASKEMHATLAMFDAHDEQILRVKYNGIPFDECTPLDWTDYVPRGGTPLNDAVLQTIELMEKKARKRDKVMLVVMTDGHENSSSANNEAVNSAITKKEDAGWAFIYLGANQDAWAEGAGRGFQAHSSYAFTSSPTGTTNTIHTVTNTATAFASATPDTYLRATKNMSEATGGVIAEDSALNLADFIDEEDEKKDED